MDAVLILGAINSLISTAFSLYTASRQAYGQEAIPEWSQILSDNLALQQKIDAEKNKDLKMPF